MRPVKVFVSYILTTRDGLSTLKRGDGYPRQAGSIRGARGRVTLSVYA